MYAEELRGFILLKLQTIHKIQSVPYKAEPAVPERELHDFQFQPEVDNDGQQDFLLT